MEQSLTTAHLYCTIIVQFTLVTKDSSVQSVEESMARSHSWKNTCLVIPMREHRRAGNCDRTLHMLKLKDKGNGSSCNLMAWPKLTEQEVLSTLFN